MEVKVRGRNVSYFYVHFHTPKTKLSVFKLQASSCKKIIEI